MILDIKTLVMAVIVICCISSFALFFFYRISKQFYGLKYAAIGAGLQAVGAISLLFKAPHFETLDMFMINVSNVMACIFYYQASRLLCDKKAPWTYPLVFMALLLPLFYMFRTADFTHERVITNLLATGVLALLGSYQVFKNADRLPGRLILAVTFFMSGPICFFAALSMLITPERVQIYTELKEFQFVFLWFIANTVLISFSFIILISEKLQHQLKVQVEMSQKARDIATESLQQQRHFLSMLSHEFKAPIGAVQANADAVLHIQKDNNPTIENSLNRIKQISRRLSSLVDHCLNNEWLAHSIEQHQTRLELISLKHVVSTICDEFSVRFSGSKKEAIIKGEPLFLPVLFSNLIANACKYASDISAVEVELVEDEQQYIIRVIDDGVGIPEAQQGKIFDRYYQASFANSSSGTGLGLYFVKRITEMHGGTVSVNCQQNTVFTVRLDKPKHIST